MDPTRSGTDQQHPRLVRPAAGDCLVTTGAPLQAELRGLAGSRHGIGARQSVVDAFGESYRFTCVAEPPRGGRERVEVVERHRAHAVDPYEGGIAGAPVTAP